MTAPQINRSCDQRRFMAPIPQPYSCMKCSAVVVLLCLISFLQVLFAQVNPNHHYVKSYTRSDGTFVQGHYKTNPNGTNRDNYSTRGNTNPYTGQAGWIQPDNNPITNYSQPAYMAKNDYRTPSSGQSGGYDYNIRQPNSSGNSYTLTLTAGAKTIRYTNGSEHFNVMAGADVPFKIGHTYTAYDPYKNEIKETQGYATGQLLDGPLLFYNESNIIQERESYSKGLAHGDWISYDDHGRPTSKMTYNQGEVVYAKVQMESGSTYEIIGRENVAGTIEKTYRGTTLLSKRTHISAERSSMTHYDEYSGLKSAEYELLNDKLDGPYTSYWEDGRTVKRKGSYLEGQKTGQQWEYSEDGQMISILNYQAGMLNGQFEYFLENGILVEKGQYRLNSLEGEVSYFDSLGRVEGLLNYHDGLLNGPFERFENGKLGSKGAFMNGEKHGRWESYLNRGDSIRLFEYTNYDRGKHNGPFMEVRYDSIIVGSYLQDRLDGPYRVYQSWESAYRGKPLEDRDLVLSGRYFNGLKTQTWEFYSTFGGLTKRGEYAVDKPHGPWSYYLPNIRNEAGDLEPWAGKLMLQRNYAYGAQNGKEERFYDTERVVVPCADQASSPWDTCYSYKVIPTHEIRYFQSDKLHGPYSLYDDQGRLVEEGEYTRGSQSGRWLTITYDEKEKLSSQEFNLESGKLNGRFVRWDGNGNVRKTGYFTNDLPSGTWQLYREDGKNVEKVLVYEGNRRTDRYLAVSGETSAIASLTQDNLIEYQRFDTLTGKLETKFRITEFIFGDYRLDVTQVKNDTVSFSQILFHSGRLERENDPKMLEMIMSISSVVSPDKIINDGTFKQSLTSGRVIMEGPCHNDLRDGQWKFYFPQDGFIYLPDYRQGKVFFEEFQEFATSIPLTRTVRFFGLSGHLEVVKVKHGLRDGHTKILDDNGKVIAIKKFKAGVEVD